MVFVTETKNNGGSNWSFKEVSNFIGTAELGLEIEGLELDRVGRLVLGLFSVIQMPNQLGN